MSCASVIHGTGYAETLKVGFYEYMPDSYQDKFQAMTERVESDIKNHGHNISAEIITTDSYSVAGIKELLEDYDIIEIDTINAEQVIHELDVIPWSSISVDIDENEYYPAYSKIKPVVKSYIVPSWMCGYFAYSKDEKILALNHHQDLIDFVSDEGLYMDFSSTTVNASYYIDCLSKSDDAYDPNNVDNLTEIDEEKIHQLKAIQSRTRISDSYQNMLDGKTKVAVGYSESSVANNEIQDTSPIYVTSVPYGKNGTPSMYMDGFIISSRVLNDTEKMSTAKAFIAYMSEAQTISWISYGDDSEALGLPSKPRYLLPAKKNVLRKDKHEDFINHIYNQCEKTQEKATVFPTHGLQHVKEMIKSHPIH